MSDSEYVETIRKRVKRHKCLLIVYGVCCLSFLGIYLGVANYVFRNLSRLFEYAEGLGPGPEYIGALFGAFAGFLVSTCLVFAAWAARSFTASLSENRARRLLLKYHDVLVARGIEVDEDQEQKPTE